MDELHTPTKFDLRHTESKVVFSICDCSLDKKYSFYSLNRMQAERFLKCLRHIEKLTWGQLISLPRDSGLTSEKSGTESFGMIDSQSTCERKLVEQYYFHFRVEQRGLFRVFGYQRDQFFCITHIDYDGRVHH